MLYALKARWFAWLYFFLSSAHLRRIFCCGGLAKCQSLDHARGVFLFFLPFFTLSLILTSAKFNSISVSVSVVSPFWVTDAMLVLFWAVSRAVRLFQGFKVSMFQAAEPRGVFCSQQKTVNPFVSGITVLCCKVCDR